MQIPKFTVSNDKNIYEAWPDVALGKDGRMICVFSECTHHGNRDYTRIMLTTSLDRGRTWTAKRPLTEGTRGLPYYYNCARITVMPDGRYCVIVDRIPSVTGENRQQLAVNVLYFSSDNGETWTKPVEVPQKGIVPDKLLILKNGRWIVAAHYMKDGFLSQFMRYSDDDGKTWSDEITIGHVPGLQLCEVSILPIDDNTLVAFMRENSFLGYDCKKAVSRDNGETWGPIVDFPLPGCHRPVAGMLNDGRIMLTYRFLQGGKGWLGSWTQNFFAAITDKDSAVTDSRKNAWARIMPVDFDRSSKSDLGYSGWVQFPDGEIYIVNYIVDDAIDKAQIRGYSLQPDAFVCF